MACKYCVFQVPIENKEDFRYRTVVMGNMLVVEKKVKNDYRILYGNTIKKCPMCGDDLLDMGEYLFSSNCDHMLLQMLTERFGKETVEKKLENFQEID